MALASLHFLGRLLVTRSPVTWCQQDPKNSLDSPPPFQSPRTSELRAELGCPGHGQQSFDRAGRAAPVCHAMVRPCCSVSFVEAGPGSDPRPFCWVPIPPPPGRTPAPLSPTSGSTHGPISFVVLPALCVIRAPQSHLASILLNHVLIISSALMRL